MKEEIKHVKDPETQKQTNKQTKRNQKQGKREDKQYLCTVNQGNSIR